jgi:quinol monooxygenase YgiN
MTVLRHYLMRAAEGRGDALGRELETLAGKVRPLAGCEKVEMFADAGDADAFIFIEYWSSVDAHKAAGAALGKEAFAGVMAVLAGPPEGRYLNPVALP